MVLFLLFGASRLPGLGKSTGEGIREFKKGLSEFHADVTEDETKPETETTNHTPATGA